MNKTLRKIGFALAVVCFFVIFSHVDHLNVRDPHAGADPCLLCQTLSTGYSLPDSIIKILFVVSLFFIVQQTLIDRQQITLTQQSRAPPVASFS